MRVSIARALVTRPRLAADGRALRRARRDHALPAQSTTCWRCGSRCGRHRGLRHPFGVRVRLSFTSAFVVMTSRPGRVFERDRRRYAVSARRVVPDLRRTTRRIAARCRRRCTPRWRREVRRERASRHVSAREPDAPDARSSSRASDPRARTRRRGLGCHRADQGDSALHPSRRPASCADAGCRLERPVVVAARDAANDIRGVCCSRSRAASGSRSCSTSRAWSNIRSIPIAVILQVTPVVAIAPLLLIYLPQRRRGARLRLDRRVLPGAGQHDARPEFRRPQSCRSVPALWRVALAGAARSEAAVGAALHSWRA